MRRFLTLLLVLVATSLGARTTSVVFTGSGGGTTTTTTTTTTTSSTTTTTSGGSTTTTTTTTTSTTTTTTSASETVTTELYLPSGGEHAYNSLTTATQSTSVTALEVQCFDFVPSVGITNATKMAFRTGTTSSGSGNFGIGIYSADGSTQIAAGSQTFNNNNQLRTITGLSAFTLNAGTMYRLCWCSDSTITTFNSLASVAVPPTPDLFSAYANAFAVHYGVASESCTSGAVPPSTATSLVDRRNANCSAASTPWPCCTGSGAGSCDVRPMRVKLATDTP